MEKLYLKPEESVLIPEPPPWGCAGGAGLGLGIRTPSVTGGCRILRPPSSNTSQETNNFDDFIKRGVPRKQQEAPTAAASPWHGHTDSSGAGPTPSLKHCAGVGGGEGGSRTPLIPRRHCVKRGLVQVSSGQEGRGACPQQVPFPSRSLDHSHSSQDEPPRKVGMGGTKCPAPRSHHHPAKASLRAGGQPPAEDGGDGSVAECWPRGSPSPAPAHLSRASTEGPRSKSLGCCVPHSTGTRTDPAEVTAAIPDKVAGGVEHIAHRPGGLPSPDRAGGTP